MVQEARELAARIKKESSQHQIGAELLDDLAVSLGERGLLPKNLPVQEPEAEVQPKSIDLVQETFDLLATVREPSPEEREELERKGFIFLTIEAKSLDQICVESQKYFDFVNPSKNLRNYIPPKTFEIAVNPSKLRIPESNNSSQEKQLRLIEQYSQKEIEPEFPEAKAIMLPATGYTQADIEFQKRNNGQKLLPNYFACALDTTDGSHVASVGRVHPGRRLYVDDWGRDDGRPHVWAVPAVVFLRK